MKIGHDHTAEQQYKYKLKRKKNLLQSALKLGTKYVDISDIKSFENNMSSHVIELLAIKIGIPNLDPRKIVQLTDIPIHKIQKAQREFNAISVDIHNPIKDFGIYSTNEKQIARYKDLQSLCDMLNKWNPGEWMWIERAFQFKVILYKGLWMPNYHNIVSIV